MGTGGSDRTNSELNEITAVDLDLEGALVWLRGGSFVEPRWGILSIWGRGWVERRMQAVAGEHRPLTYDGNGSAQSRQAAACVTISSTLARAGLAEDPIVRPLSVTAWSGRQLLDDIGRIEVVAQRLGMRSLDRTALLIGFDWRAAAEHGDR